MRKIILILGFIMSIFVIGSSQNRSINFETGTFDEIVNSVSVMILNDSRSHHLTGELADITAELKFALRVKISIPIRVEGDLPTAPNS